MEKIKWKRGMFPFIPPVNLPADLFSPRSSFPRQRCLMEIEAHNKTRTKKKLHFENRSFTIFNITIFRFQVAAG